MTPNATHLTTVLLDLDGVVRHFDPSFVPSLERRHGLTRGVLQSTAFEPDLLNSAITGQISRAQWVDAVGERVGNSQAAAEWLAELGFVDQEMLDEVTRLRDQGITVAVLTNGTDTVPTEMHRLGLDDRFDAIFSSAAIGYAKPDRRAFESVCDALGIAPSTVFFTDDSTEKLSGAVEIGMTARLFEGIDVFREHLTEVGIPTS